MLYTFAGLVVVEIMEHSFRRGGIVGGVSKDCYSRETMLITVQDALASQGEALH